MLEVRTGSRLHFGLMELCRGEPLYCGGLGLMLEYPSLTLRFERVTEDCPTRLKMPPEFAERTRRVLELRLGSQPGPRPEQIEMVHSPDLHTGLGTGTQLACAIALGLEVFAQQLIDHRFQCGVWLAGKEAIAEIPQEPFLVKYSGRGLRSAIGLAGFLAGGLIFDQGYPTGAGIARSVQVHASMLPESWRVVTICPRNAAALSGDQESKLLEAVGQQANPNREHMRRLAQQLMQACGDGNFSDFSQSLEQYMGFAGEMFRAQQGGLYNGGQVSQAVAIARKSGLNAVGQSSWGPTVFGFTINEELAKAAVKAISTELPDSQWRTTLTRPAMHGAQFRWGTSPSA